MILKSDIGLPGARLKFCKITSAQQTWGQSYKADFGINYIKNRLNKLNFTLNYINFDVIYAKKVL